MQTRNLDIADLANYFISFRTEIEKMASTFTFNVNGFDIGRMEQYISVLQEKLDNLSPAVDRPKWHRPENLISIPEVPSEYGYDNKALEAFLRKMDATYYELAHSQSGDMSGDLQQYDKDRLQSGIDELAREIELIKNISPVDAPESANINS